MSETISRQSTWADGVCKGRRITISTDSVLAQGINMPGLRVAAGHRQIQTFSFRPE